MDTVFDIYPLFEQKLKVFHTLYRRNAIDSGHESSIATQMKQKVFIHKNLIHKIILYDPISLHKPDQDIQFPAEIWSMDNDYTTKEYAIINLNKEIITYAINGDILPLGKYIKELIVDALNKEAQNDSKIRPIIQ